MPCIAIATQARTGQNWAGIELIFAVSDGFLLSSGWLRHPAGMAHFSCVCFDVCMYGLVWYVGVGCEPYGHILVFIPVTHYDKNDFVFAL